MSEEPKSIWSRPWKGRAKVLGWLAILTAAVFLFVFGYRLGIEGNRSIPKLILFSLLFSVIISVLVAVAVLFVRWLCCWRNLRRVLFGVACAITLVALFYAEENWRGWHAWQKFKHEWEAKGEHFDLASIVPPPVPDDQNFAMTPLWVETVCASMSVEQGRIWYGDRVAALGHTNFVRRLVMPTELDLSGLDATTHIGNWQKSEKADLRTWQAYYRKVDAITNFFPVTPQAQTPAEDVLLALSKYDLTIEELRRASELPDSRFPLGYADADPAAILLPHLASLRGCAMTLRLRTLAELEAGQVEKALDDVELMLRLTASIRTEPFFISHLVRIAMLHTMLQPVWEGLGDHRWNDAQLTLLETELGKLDFLGDYQFAMRAERALDVGILDYVRGTWQLDWLAVEDGIDSHFRFPMWLARFVPSGWFEQNKVACCRMNFDLLVPIVNQETRVVSPAAEARATNAFNEIRVTPCNWLAGLLMPALTRCSSKFAYAQTAADLARIACALERYRLAHSEYPESLGVLVPQYVERIPHDIIGGQPLKYRRTDD
ncbi:MAG: hypothetical protein AAB380_05355, partial [Verrucomicrobiota bacterium]